jgi:hypothetical protein
MTIVKTKVNPDKLNFLRVGRIDTMAVDNTTEQDIAILEAIDASEAMQDMSAFVRRVRTSLGLNQAEFSRLLNVSFDTYRSLIFLMQMTFINLHFLALLLIINTNKGH